MASDPTAILQAVEGVTTDPHVIDGMLVGSFLESGWDPGAVGDGSYGPWQLQLNDGAYGGVTDAEAESPTFAAQRMVGEYTTAAADVPAALWTSNPELAAETTAYKAERPEYDYYQGQGAAKVNSAWAATVKLLGATPPTTATTTSIVGDVTNPVGAAASAVAGAAEKSVAGIAMEMLGIAAAIGLIIVGAVKTTSPGTKLSGKMPTFGGAPGGGGSKGAGEGEAGGGLEDAAVLA